MIYISNATALVLNIRAIKLDGWITISYKTETFRLTAI